MDKQTKMSFDVKVFFLVFDIVLLFLRGQISNITHKSLVKILIQYVLYYKHTVIYIIILYSYIYI